MDYFLSGTSTVLDASTSLLTFGSSSTTPLSAQLFYTNSLLVIIATLLAIDLLRRIFGKHSFN